MDDMVKACKIHGELTAEKLYFIKMGAYKKMACKMCQQKSSKEYYDKNKDKHRERAKKYYLQNKNAMDEYYSSWHKKHEDRLRLMEKKAFAAQIKRLDDRYVKRLMMKRGMLPEQMSQPLIELYKILILIKREINQKLKEKAK